MCLTLAAGLHMSKKKRQASFSAKLSKKGTKPTRVSRRMSPPVKPKNIDVRKREYLTPDEVKTLREAAKNAGRNGFRDELLIMMMYRHGLRVSEATDLKWEQLSLVSCGIICQVFCGIKWQSFCGIICQYGNRRQYQERSNLYSVV
jgi:site-specific recombinase XerD